MMKQATVSQIQFYYIQYRKTLVLLDRAVAMRHVHYKPTS